jgi:1-acyl-sn-glycerol-3-phosphate acyltransferase
MPADEIVLAPPHSVLKTSSGKIRRAASREAFERGEVGRRQAPTWLQQARLALAAVKVSLGGTAKQTGRKLYGAYAWLVLIAFAMPVWLAVAILNRPSLGRIISHHAARLAFRAAGIGLDPVPNDRLPEYPHVLAVNHASYLDSLALGALLPPRYTFIAKRELVGQWVPRLFLRGLGTIFVERFDAARSAEDVEDMIAALRCGQSLAVFPEGTFSRESGLKPFRMGAFVAAARATAPVVVAGLRGTRVMLRAGTWLPRRGCPEFELGAVLRAEGGDWASAVHLREAVRTEMLRLSGEHDLGGFLPDLPSQ